MTPELSARIAFALHMLPVGRLPLAKRERLGNEADGCDTFEELPGWIQALVIEGEEQPTEE